jgi:hypothetical protein
MYVVNINCLYFHTKPLTYVNKQTSGSSKFHFDKNNKQNVGMNSISNNFHYLNDSISLEWFNKTSVAYKIEYKTYYYLTNIEMY